MFICNDCLEIFDEPGVITEREKFEAWGAVFTHKFNYECCPKCGSDDFEKATVCGLCDEPVHEKFDYCKYHLDAINSAMDLAVHAIEESADIGTKREAVIDAIGAWLEDKED